MRTLALRSAALPRASYAFTAGFLKHLLGVYALRAIKRGVTVVEARQVFHPLTGGLRRVACAVSIPTRR
ncbi:MAG: hypothetical protein ACREP5_09955 [Candidatus Binatia bacterium]